MDQLTVTLIVVAVFFFLLLVFNSVKILREYERGVVFRLGRLVGVRGPGIIWLWPFIERMVKVSLRTVVMDVPPQDIITQDNVSLKVNAVVYFRVIQPGKAIVEVENYLFATSQLSQTTLRSVLGQSELDDLLSQRDKINQKLQQIIDSHTEPWGVKVSNVEVKQIDLPQEMQRAMAKQAEAERERRSKIIAAEGEFQASQRLSDAAKVLSEQPSALTLRYTKM
jgi:regulator of protease activity HflC (stomatin/prohibitin superfamily)